ncbi:hypothetical protein C8J56DRAFT_895221 [Mycena floridula]|nr:hypothetical protein C8J56DRAFT_895221 [Mycena floridula]
MVVNKNSSVDPTTVRDHFQHFGEISRIWNAFKGISIKFASPERAQKLLDTSTDGEVTTESGETYRIKSWVPKPDPPASTHLLVMPYKPNVKEADIQNAFSKFGPIKKVILEEERPAIGEKTFTKRAIPVPQDQLYELKKLYVKTKTIENAQKLKVLESTEFPINFIVKHHHSDEIPQFNSRRGPKRDSIVTPSKEMEE